MVMISADVVPRSYDNSYDLSRQGQAAKVEQSALTSAEDAFNYAMVISERIRKVVDKLCGSQPTTALAENTTTPDISIFDSLQKRAHSANSSLSLAEAALDRLERALP